MPSLMPGVAGAKEIYGIAILGEDLSFPVPGKALERYGLKDDDPVALTQAHKNEPGFALVSVAKASGSVMEIEPPPGNREESIFLHRGRCTVIRRIQGGRVRLGEKMAIALRLRAGEELLVIKGAAIAMAYVPVAVWREKLGRRNLTAAIEAINGLEIYR
jgi:hypothetical protein